MYRRRQPSQSHQKALKDISVGTGDLLLRILRTQKRLCFLAEPFTCHTQRALMQPDEVMRMDNRQCLVLLRGQKPMLLYKIIPDEFAAFQKL